MRWVWASFLAMIVSMTFINHFISPLGETIDIFVYLHLFIVMAILLMKGKAIKGILIAALLARFALMIWDVHFSHIYTLPNSGSDSHIFLSHAIDVSQDMTLWYKYLRTGYYSRLLGTIFYLTGSSQMLAQYINVLLGLSTVMMIYKTLGCISIDDRTRKLVLIIAAFFPNSMVMSSILLREILPTFFVSVSIYQFIRWFKGRKLGWLACSMITLALASVFHSGVMGVMLGYGFAVIFYKHSSQRFVFSPRSLTAFGILLLLAVFLLTYARETILSQIKGESSLSDLLPRINTREGNAAYLRGFMAYNFAQVVLYTPLRFVYFLFSPLPYDWRNAMDAFTFMADASFYFYVLYALFSQRRKLGTYKPMMVVLVLSLIGAVLIFALGTGNAGTAFRHRQKLTPLFLLILGIVKHRQYGYRLAEREKAISFRASQSLR